MLIASRQTLVMSAADSIKEAHCDISQIKEKRQTMTRRGESEALSTSVAV